MRCLCGFIEGAGWDKSLATHSTGGRGQTKGQRSPLSCFLCKAQGLSREGALGRTKEGAEETQSPGRSPWEAPLWAPPLQRVLSQQSFRPTRSLVPGHGTRPPCTSSAASVQVDFGLLGALLHLSRWMLTNAIVDRVTLDTSGNESSVLGQCTSQDLSIQSWRRHRLPSGKPGQDAWISFERDEREKPRSGKLMASQLKMEPWPPLVLGNITRVKVEGGKEEALYHPTNSIQ